ncbi:hypothetical protein QYP05_29825, partial [Pseudomonas aeruginosa]|nr:hypothetical protein [Pseudomonas aeruginosa]
NSTLTGKRSVGRHVTLQNLYKMLELLTKSEHVASLDKEEKLMLCLVYFNSIKEQFNKEWLNYKEYRLTHIVCLNALAIAGNEVFSICVGEEKRTIDYNQVTKCVKKLNNVEWSAIGPLRYIKGLSGSRTLANELITQMV